MLQSVISSVIKENGTDRLPVNFAAIWDINGDVSPIYGAVTWGVSLLSQQMQVAQVVDVGGCLFRAQVCETEGVKRLQIHETFDCEWWHYLDVEINGTDVWRYHNGCHINTTTHYAKVMHLRVFWSRFALVYMLKLSISNAGMFGVAHVRRKLT